MASILQAAEAAAQRLRADTEARMRDRIAEGDRAAEYRVTAAEEEAAEIVARARESAAEIMAESDRRAARSRQQAETYCSELLGEAQAIADEVRTEGLELVSNLRRMGDSLRINAGRLLRDVQEVHADMVGRIERLEAGRRAANARFAPGSGTADGARRNGDGVNGRAATLEGGDLPDVPEFIPPR